MLVDAPAGRVDAALGHPPVVCGHEAAPVMLHDATLASFENPPGVVTM